MFITTKEEKDMTWPANLVFVRHAESEGNVMGVNQRAQADSANYRFALTERGEKQAVITGEYLRQRFGKFDEHFASYYKRAKQTLRIMFPKARIIEDSRLAEGQRGIWQTMTHDQIELIFPDEIARRKKESFYHYRPFGGENWPDIELRVHSFLDMLAREGGNKNVLVVSHGHWLIMLRKIMERLSAKEAVRLLDQEPFENASVTVYSRKRGKKNLGLEACNLIPWRDKL